jgi:hypothetical protein
MEPLHILVTNSIGEANMKKIAAADPRIRVTEITELVRADREGDAKAKAELDACWLTPGSSTGSGCRRMRSPGRRT